MKLNMLCVEATKEAKIPEGLLFRWKVHHVKEIFMSLLPKIEINGSSKIQIDFGPRGMEDEFDGVLGVTNIFIEDFDFEKFYLLSQKDQDIIILKKVEESLLQIYNRRGSDDSVVEIIKETACSVLRLNFDLKVPIKKLFKTSRDRRYKISIYRVLNAVVGEGWVCEITDNNTLLSREEWMNNTPDYLDRTDFFKKSELKNEVFVVFDWLGNAVFQLDLPHETV